MTFNKAMIESVQGWDAALAALDALLYPSDAPLSTLANAASWLGLWLPDINWCGFYLATGDDLVLGPFTGLPACTRIAKGKGVCGTAFAERRTISVPDVHLFPGHIACDAASESEVVVPLLDAEGNVWAVLDVDAPRKSRFSDADVEGLQRAAALVMTKIRTTALL